MLNTGISKNNQVFGDAYVQNGTLSVDGKIQLGSGPDYYTIPNTQGDVGDVLKLVAPNEVGFGDEEFPSTASMIGYVDQPKTVYSNSLEKIWDSFVGSTQVSLKAFKEGSVWECEFEGII